MAVKLLLAGSVKGSFDALRKRIEAVNKKAGPFGACLCVGQFFEDGDEDEEMPSNIQECVDNSKPFPIPVYFVGAVGKGSRSALTALADAPQECTLKYLGQSGITKVSGLTVAFLDDAPGASAEAGPMAAATADAVKQLQDRLSTTGDVDILLTGTWPGGVTTGAQRPEGLEDVQQTEHSAALATAARPRYHVSTSPAFFYQRAPYTNPDLGVGEHATRFLSCAAVGNAGKAKWVHALGLTPAAAAVPTSGAAQVPADSTPSPYAGDNKRRNEDVGEQSWRWDGSAKKKAKTGKEPPAVPIVSERSVYVKNLPYGGTEEDLEAFFSRAGTVEAVRWSSNADGSRQGWAHVQFASTEGAAAALPLTGESLMGRELHIDAATATGGVPELNLGKPVKDCWFCLSNEQADVQLVVDVSEEAYLAVDKGPISETHALVLPVEHYPNTLTSLPGALREMEGLVEALAKAYASKGLVPIGFERYLGFHSRGGNHCHMNFVGVSKAQGASARVAFEEAAQRYHFKFQHVADCSGEAGREALKALVGDSQYFQVFLPDGGRLVSVIGRDKKHPMHFGREVLANLAGVPECADWRNCRARDGKEEDARADKFRTFFAPFSPNT